MKKYKNVACGGTFDLLHRGHKEFLRFALYQGERLLIGITSDTYKDSKREEIASFAERKKNVLDFLEKEGVLNRIMISPIHDLYGPLLETTPIDVLVVSEETTHGAVIINTEREKKGLQKLDVLMFLSVKAEDGEIISSTRIRQGAIDREGNIYVRPSWVSQTLRLPESIRLQLKRPIGALIKQNGEYIKKLDSIKTVTVGDVVTKMCNDKSFLHRLSIIDFIVQRKKQYNNIAELGFSGKEKVIQVTNPAGFITPQLFRAIQAVFQEKGQQTRFVIQVGGEEDLAVLPVLLVAPLGYTILYGQPHEGFVQIAVTEESKNMARGFVSRFDS